jgi:hypothetical protein
VGGMDDPAVANSCFLAQRLLVDTKTQSTVLT